MGWAHVIVLSPGIHRGNELRATRDKRGNTPATIGAERLALRTVGRDQATTPPHAHAMRGLSRIFWNTSHHRLRAGWRLLLHFILIVAITVGRDAFAQRFGSTPLPTTLAFLAYLASGLGLTWWFARHIDRRAFADFGLHLDRQWWLDVLVGLALGALLMTGIFFSMKVTGWVAVVGFASTNAGVPFIIAFLLKVIAFSAVAINEELAFRGYQLKNLAEGIVGGRIGAHGAIVFAMVLSSAFFGLTHLANRGSTAVSALVVMCAGLLLSLPYLLTGELGVSIGLHLTWNLFEGPVYGFPVSGSLPAAHLVSIEQSGPALWTGGSFGPEAGLIGLVWALVGCGVTIGWVKWNRGRVALHAPLATHVRWDADGIRD